MSVLKEVHLKNADILYDNGTEDVLKKIEAKRYSHILVAFSSEDLVQQLKRDYGERLSVFSKRTEGSPSTVWQIR